MNPFDYVKASGGGDSLMPVLIFIIWIVISFFSNARKKRIKLDQKRLRSKKQVPETYRAPESAAFPATMTQNEEKRAPLYDEIRHQLETVLSTKPTDSSVDATQLEESDVSLETQEVEEQSYEIPAPVSSPVSGPSKPPLPLSAADPITAYDIAMPPGESDGIASSAITDVFSKDFQDKNDVKLLVAREEVRKGFVWSEILAPPVSLRDQF
jgi:hypothetical protein